MELLETTYYGIPLISLGAPHVMQPAAFFPVMALFTPTCVEPYKGN